MQKDMHDPKGLIREAYRIEGITIAECRTIFLDWALGSHMATETKDIVRALINQYSDAPPDHPMTKTLVEALEDTGPARRRGGRQGRLADQ